MNEAELQQENKKLQERLKKAITVFNEQNANIQKITSENKSLTEQLEKLKGVNEKNENDTAELNALQIKIQTLETLLSNNEALMNKKIETINNTLNERNEFIEKQKETIEELNKKILETTNNDEKFFEQLDEINQLEEKNKTLMNDYTKLQNTFEAYKADSSIKEQKLQNEVKELHEKLDILNNRLTKAVNAANENKQKIETTVEAAKKTVNQMQQLGNDFITNFNIFA